MSELCEIETRFKDIDAVHKACQELGWELIQGGQVRYYGGPAGECDYTIEMHSEENLKKRYNLGLVQQADGSYHLMCDNSMRGPVRRDGTLAGETPRIKTTLEDSYNFAVFQAQADMMGWQYDVEVQENGTRVAYVNNL